MIGHLDVVKFLEICINYFILKKGMCDEAMVAIAILDALEEGSDMFKAEGNEENEVVYLLHDYYIFKSQYKKKQWKAILESALLILDIKHGCNNDFDEETARKYESIWNDALDNAITTLNSKGFEVCTVSLPNGYVVMYHIQQNFFEQCKADWTYVLTELEPTFDAIIEVLGDSVSKEFIKKFWNTKGDCFRKGFWKNAHLREQVWKTFFITETYVVDLQ